MCTALIVFMDPSGAFNLSPAYSVLSIPAEAVVGISLELWYANMTRKEIKSVLFQERLLLRRPEAPTEPVIATLRPLNLGLDFITNHHVVELNRCLIPNYDRPGASVFRSRFDQGMWDEGYTTRSIFYRVMEPLLKRSSLHKAD